MNRQQLIAIFFTVVMLTSAVFYVISSI